MNRPLLSIAIPTYNRADLLDLCLGRIINQLDADNTAIELLVSNNASTDHTKQVIEKYQQKFERLRYSENEENGGPDFNIAKCFELATGKYVWVFSNDDVILPGALGHILTLLQQSDVGIIYLEPKFYRHSVDEFEVLGESLSYKEYDKPLEFTTDIHFWLTFISGIITNKELIKDIYIPPHYQKSFLIQLSWVLPVLFRSKVNIKVTTPCILVRVLDVLDFKLFHVFGTSYPKILTDLVERKLIPVEAKNILIDLIITRYFPYYITPDYTYRHGERPFLILGKAYWREKRFWTVLMPRFISRSVKRGLKK